MNCPSCAFPLSPIWITTVSVDACFRCKGFWLRKKETGILLDALAGQASSSVPAENAADRRKETAVSDPAQGKPRPCPQCRRPMRQFNYAYDSNVFLDQCVSCERIWMDGGEIQQIVGSLRENLVTQREFLEKETEQEELKALAQAAKILSGRVAYPYWITRAIPRVIIPLSDEFSPDQRFPVVTAALLIIFAVVFAGLRFFDPEGYIRFFGVMPAGGLHARYPGALFFGAFVHANWVHLLGNCCLLWIFGDNVENRLGAAGYLALFVLGAAASVGIQILFYPSYPGFLLGSSGGVASVLGAYAVFFPKNRVNTYLTDSLVDIPARVWLWVWFFFQIVLFALWRLLDMESVFGYFAHAGGFLFGVFVAMIFSRKSSGQQPR